RRATAHPDFYSGAQNKAAELGFQLEHFWLREPGLTHGRLSHILYARGIAGVIIASHVREFDLALQFDWSQFSAIKIDYFPHQPELHNVTNNQLQIIRLAMQKVIAAGYRRIGLVMDEGYDITVDRLWSAGYLWEQQGVRPRERIPPLMHPAGFAAWYREHRPEVILSKAEFVAEPMAALGLQVPRDVAFVDLFLERTDGATAGVRQNHATVGELAIEILVGQLQHNKFGVPQIPTTTYVEGTWFEGASCPLSR
ncbi:MAG TPA: LacI family transcriptional regulator, partial [Opitutaceae bacterium]|nr:LacI family transcriptional regulator [Opitutaceae bacterium]